MRRLRAAAVVVLIAAVILVGCSDDPSDPGDPMSTWTPTGKLETPTTTTDPLTDPPPDETAEQFIRRWIKLSDAAQNSGDLEEYRKVAGPDCRSCRQFAARVERIYAAGGSITTAGSRVKSLHHDGASQWTVRLVGAPSEIVESTGTPADRLPGGPYRLTVYVARSSGGWVVAAYVANPS